MKKLSEYQKGDMFFFNPLDLEYMKPEVYVKFDEGEVQGVEATIFIKNSALVKSLISNQQPYISDLWAMGERYFDQMTKDGHIIPIDDIREAEELCEKFNLTMEPVM